MKAAVSAYRWLRPSLSIRTIDPATARVGLTVNKYATNAAKTNHTQRAVLKAVAASGQPALSQGEREETLAVDAPQEERMDHVNPLLERFGLKSDADCEALLMDRMASFLDVDEWAKDGMERST
jgi:hypothetical protein